MPMCHPRDFYFDLVKAFAIFLVVLGHVKASSELDCVPLENFIVGANMPLFFILSGWFAHLTIANCDVKRLIKHLRSYLQPVLSTALVFAILAASVGIISWKFTDIGMYAIKRILFATWFLWVLSIVYLICFVVSLIVREFSWQLVGLLLSFCVLLFIPNVWQIQSVRHMMPYFIIGMVLRRYTIRPWITSWGAFCLILYIAFVILEGNVRENHMGFYWVDSSWRGIFSGMSDIFAFVVRNIVGVIGAIGIMWGIYKLRDHLPGRTLMAIIGRYTICIYLLHHWMIERLSYIWPELFASWACIAILGVLLTIGCAAIGWLTIEKCKVSQIVVWGR